MTKLKRGIPPIIYRYKKDHLILVIKKYVDFSKGTGRAVDRRVDYKILFLILFFTISTKVFNYIIRGIFDLSFEPYK